MIDLHIHSTASDGSLNPIDILTLAKKTGVKAVSITDHDTIQGVKQLLKNQLPHGVEFITGVEISCEPPQEFKELGSIHLLGYGFSIYDQGLNQLLDTAQKSRTDRNPKIIDRLNHLGFEMTMKDVVARFGADQTGRPHIAEYMKEKGYVGSFSEAFDKYLGKGKPAYVDKYKVSCKEAIQIIKNAGGVAVLAHPGLINFTRTGQDDEFIDTLINYGLDGMEVYYTDHDSKQTTYYHNLAIDKSLLITGGSDFHGTFNTGVALGTGKGGLYVDLSLFREICRYLETHKNRETDLNLLQENLDHFFSDLSLLENALCHRSYLNENQNLCKTDNERLEFLGDAVVGLCIAHLLMETLPDRNEGELSKFRSNLVSEPGLAKVARLIDLGRFIQLGRGENQSRGFDKNSILSDAFEAVIAAVYLDGGFDTAYRLVCRLFANEVEQVLSKEKVVDYKSMLQEIAQERGTETPEYQVHNEIGPDHDKTFEISLNLYDINAIGSGRTKKAAEQDAARQALDFLEN